MKKSLFVAGWWLYRQNFGPQFAKVNLLAGTQVMHIWPTQLPIMGGNHHVHGQRNYIYTHVVIQIQAFRAAIKSFAARKVHPQQEIIALPTDSTNSWRYMRPPRMTQSSLLTQRICMRFCRVLSQNNVLFAYFYREMDNSKRCGWEECKRDSRIPKKVVWVAK